MARNDTVAHIIQAFVAELLDAFTLLWFYKKNDTNSPMSPI